MKERLIAAALAAAQLLGSFDTAACARAQAAEPFPQVNVEPVVQRPHLVADLTLAAGVGLIGASFLWRDRANRFYSDYLSETDPARIQALFDRTLHEDRLSSSSLISGELLAAAGLYLRFLRRPAAARLDLSLLPQRCAVSWRF